MRLDGKVAIVTASTRGIGLACTQRLAREGAIVYTGRQKYGARRESCKRTE